MIYQKTYLLVYTVYPKCLLLLSSQLKRIRKTWTSLEVCKFYVLEQQRGTKPKQKVPVHGLHYFHEQPILGTRSHMFVGDSS